MLHLGLGKSEKQTKKKKKKAFCVRVEPLIKTFLYRAIIFYVSEE